MSGASHPRTSTRVIAAVPGFTALQMVRAAQSTATRLPHGWPRIRMTTDGSAKPKRRSADGDSPAPPAAPWLARNGPPGRFFAIKALFLRRRIPTASLPSPRNPAFAALIGCPRPLHRSRQLGAKLLIFLHNRIALTSRQIRLHCLFNDLPGTTFPLVPGTRNLTENAQAPEKARVFLRSRCSPQNAPIPFYFYFLLLP